jgi:hypothetical protein
MPNSVLPTIFPWHSTPKIIIHFPDAYYRRNHNLIATTGATTFCPWVELQTIEAQELPFSSYGILFINICRSSCVGDQHVTMPLRTKGKTSTELTHTSMLRVGLEHMILVIEWQKTTHTSGRAATAVVRLTTAGYK